MFLHLLTVPEPQTSPKIQLSLQTSAVMTPYSHTPQGHRVESELPTFLLPQLLSFSFLVKHPTLWGPMPFDPTTFSYTLPLLASGLSSSGLATWAFHPFSSPWRTTTTIQTITTWRLGILASLFPIPFSPVLYISTYFQVTRGILSSCGVAPVPKARA